jgi:hypothetical protein
MSDDDDLDDALLDWRGITDALVQKRSRNRRAKASRSQPRPRLAKLLVFPIGRRSGLIRKIATQMLDRPLPHAELLAGGQLAPAGQHDTSAIRDAMRALNPQP